MWCLCPAESWYWAGGAATDTEMLGRKKKERDKRKNKGPRDAIKCKCMKHERDGAWGGLGAKQKELQIELSIMEPGYADFFIMSCVFTASCLHQTIISHPDSIKRLWFTMISRSSWQICTYCMHLLTAFCNTTCKLDCNCTNYLCGFHPGLFILLPPGWGIYDTGKLMEIRIQTQCSVSDLAISCLHLQVCLELKKKKKWF